MDIAKSELVTNPKCDHSTDPDSLAPHYEEAATELKSKKSIKLAKVSPSILSV